MNKIQIKPKALCISCKYSRVNFDSDPCAICKLYDYSPLYESVFDID